MNYTITTPLYYVNDRPHLGSAYTTLASDALARYQRLRGRSVMFVTGCDEHGQKIQRTAEAAHVSPQENCNRISEEYRHLWSRWQISNDRFIRTTDPRHKIIVEQFFRRVEAAGDIIEGQQQGWYCVACEEFKDDKIDSEEEERPQCSIHRQYLEWRDEPNLFFRLSHYQEQIEELIRNPNFIFPINRRREIENFVNKGLHDFSISRVNLPWGIPVPGHQGHTFYVWFDALIGYLTALLRSSDPPDLDIIIKRGWPANIHIIGKDILRFHAVYWPAMLMSAGLEIPHKVFGHGFLTREGQKMGKSLGNILNPETLLDQYGRDPVRWYLLRDIPFGEDGDFQQQRFNDLVNNDLANTIGNLLNRTLSMTRRWFSNSVPPADTAISVNHPLAEAALTAISITLQAMEKLDFRCASETILKLAIDANIFLNDQAPWSKIKEEKRKSEVASDLYAVLETTRIVAFLLIPILPELSVRLQKQLGIEKTLDGAEVCVDDSLWDLHLRWGNLVEGNPLPEPTPVIARLELETKK
ncbi:methionine--tRNA ligase (chromatophore) [Paulinella micropora]|uniref:methionine--tRNA ligase n=1 Tax=Paulinella micropora TaxID=1928728 RepID=A0A1L5YB56_9EUKA|nr:methionine--tRNA ligase [Paulinella micropora]AQX44702.1 methionine--tRNA ligase [Paulinella micropora]BBL85910.1 methionine--tRNA ligase [Paulinella micropora]